MKKNYKPQLMQRKSACLSRLSAARVSGGLTAFAAYPMFPLPFYYAVLYQHHKNIYFIRIYKENDIILIKKFKKKYPTLCLTTRAGCIRLILGDLGKCVE